MARKKFTVVLEIPPDATVVDCRDYIHDAVVTWRGSLHPPDDDDPGDPLFNLDTDSVRVTVQRKKK